MQVQIPGVACMGGARYHWSRIFFFILLLGFAIRLFAFQYTYVINPDGAYYINQAKALYFAKWDHFTSCGLTYLSNYPIFIAAAYPIPDPITDHRGSMDGLEQYAQTVIQSIINHLGFRGLNFVLAGDIRLGQSANSFPGPILLDR